LRTFGVVAYLTFLLFALIPVGALLLSHETHQGLAGGLCGVCLLLFPGALLLSIYRPALGRIKRWLPPTVVGVSVVALATFLASSVPSGHPPASSRVGSTFLKDSRYRPYSMFNLIPEVDQVKTTLTLIPFVDPFIDRAQAGRIEDTVVPLYRALRADPDFRELGSVMNYSYRAPLGGRPDHGHFYWYRPRKGPLPAILFLHGSGGNFKVYLWAWKRFADTHGYAILCPSFGFGNWTREGAIETVERVRKYAIDHFAVDEKWVFLAGLSNGNLGVSRVGANCAGHYKGLLFISPVFDTNAISTPAFSAGWRGRPIAVITGGQDRRVTEEYTAERVKTLREGGADVTYRVFEREDHFLFLSKLGTCLEVISDWITKEH
jgi:predicted esterase